jgi:hypothetical protein
LSNFDSLLHLLMRIEIFLKEVNRFIENKLMSNNKKRYY